MLPSFFRISWAEAEPEPDADPLVFKPIPLLNFSVPIFNGLGNPIYYGDGAPFIS